MLQRAPKMRAGAFLAFGIRRPVQDPSAGRSGGHSQARWLSEGCLRGEEADSEVNQPPEKAD